MPQTFLEGRTKHSWEEIQGQIEEQGLKKRSSGDGLTWGSTPYADTELKRYCGCYEVLIGRSQVWMLQSLLEGRKKHSLELIMGQIEEQGLKKKLSKDCLT